MVNHSNRRAFLKTFAFTTIALALAPFQRWKPAFAALVSATDPLVKALGYINVEKAEKDLKSKEKSVQMAAQIALKDRKDKKAYCRSCQFYGDPTGKAATSKCQLIPGGEVESIGWCHSYSVRPTIKNPAAKNQSPKKS